MLLLFCALYAVSAENVPEKYHAATKKVLLIHSYDIWHQQNYNLLPSFRRVMSSTKIPYVIEQLELDGQKDRAPDSWQRKLEIYLPALQAGQFDAVLTFNAPAAEILQKNISRLHPDTAVIFCAPEQWDSTMRKQHQKQMAIFCEHEITANIYLAMRLLPDNKKIILLLDHTHEAQKILRSLPDIANLAPGINILPLTPADMTDVELFDYLAALDQHSLVLYYGWLKQPDSGIISQPDFFAKLCNSSAAPFLSMREALLPYDIIGGQICSDKEVGRRAANILLAFFDGRDASLMQAERITSQLILNWDLLKKTHASTSRLPSDTIFRNRPPSLWIAKRDEIILFAGSAAVLLLLAMLITLVLVRQKQKKHLHDAIFAHLPIRFFVADYDGNILLNEVGNRKFLDPRKYQFCHINELPDIDVETFLATIRETIRTAKAMVLNFTFRGSSRTASFSKLPTYLFGKETVIWVSQDTSELQQSRRVAQDNAERFLQTLKSIGDAVVVTDAEGKITIINNVALGLAERNEEECRGKLLSEVFHVVSYNDNKPVLPPVEEVISTRKIVELSSPVDLILLNGERRHIASSAAPIFDGQENITGVVLVFRDITEQHRQRQQKEQLERKQEKLIAQLNNFIENERLLNHCLSQIVLEYDFQRNIERIFVALAQQFGCDQISIGHFDYESNGFEFEHSWSAPELQGLWERESKHLAAFYPSMRELFEQDSLLKVPDCQQGTFDSLTQDSKIKSFTAAPIMVHGSLWGILSIVFLKKQRSFTEIEEKIIQSSCKIIALAHIQSKQHAAIRQADLEKKVILNNVQIPIWLYDANGTLLRVNTAVSKYFGILEILALEQAENVLFGDDVPPSQRPLQQVIKTGKPASMETRVNHFDFLVTAEPVVDANGCLINIVECAVNITDINEAKRQQELAIKAALEADRAKSFFLATMSHEIRTPLNVVIGYSELLQQKKLTEKEQDEYLHSIHCAGNALLQLINDILDLSKIEAGQMRIAVAKTDFAALCEEIYSLFKQPKKGKNVSVDLLVSPMPFLFVDQLRLRQVLLNLMGNAVKFTQQGSVTLSASFTYESESSGILEFSVSDTGRGISTVDLQKLFTPFVRLDECRDNGELAPGTGLGLSISNRLVKQMGGTISVQSELRKGTQFTVKIPNVACSKEQEKAERQAELAEPTEEKPPALSVLIIDDVEMNLKVLLAMLNKCQVQVTAKTSAKQALEALKKERFDLILTDMWMPQMNGAEFAEEVKKNPQWQKIPIIAVTADIENHQNFKMQNFSGVILKPLTLQKISSLVNALRSHQPPPLDKVLDIV